MSGFNLEISQDGGLGFDREGGGGGGRPPLLPAVVEGEELAVAVEWVGLGRTLAQSLTANIPAGADPLHLFRVPMVSDAFVCSSPSPKPDDESGASDWTFRFPVDDDATDGKAWWFDVWVDEAEMPPVLPPGNPRPKLGTFFVVDRIFFDTGGGNFVTQITARPISLTVLGANLLSTGFTQWDASTSFAMFYLPRMTTSRNPTTFLDDIDFLREEVKSVDFDPRLTNWTTQLSQSLPPEGGLASTSGFSFSALFDGADVDPLGLDWTIDGIASRREGRDRTWEGLLSTRKWTLGEDVGTDLGRREGALLRDTTYSGIGLTERIFDQPSDNGAVWQTYDPLNIVTGPDRQRYVQSAFALNWGNDQTDWVIRSLPPAPNSTEVEPTTKSATDFPMIYECLEGVFGSEPVQIPNGAETWTTPPSAIGRRVRLWLFDPRALNPWRTLRLLHDGFIDSWDTDRTQTEISFACVDALSRLRATDEWDTWEAKPGDSDVVRNETDIGPPATNKFFNPFDLWFAAKFQLSHSDTTRSVQAETFESQWCYYKGWAFPRQKLVYNESDRPALQGGDDLFLMTTLWKASATPLRADAESVSQLLIRKCGIPVGDEDEDFNYGLIEGADPRYTEFTNGSLIPWNHPANTRRSLRRSTELFNWVQIGYRSLPTRPHQSRTARFNEFSGNSRHNEAVRWDLNGVDAGDWVYNARTATMVYDFFADKHLGEEALAGLKPHHVFFSNRRRVSREFHLDYLRGTEEAPLFSPNGVFRGAGLETYITLPEAILQVLLSTGTFEFDDTLSWRTDGYPSVKPGRAGPYDVLPLPFGMGVPPSMIDIGQIENFEFVSPTPSPYSSLDDRGRSIVRLRDVVLRNLHMSIDDAADPAKWLSENLLKPFGLALTISTKGMRLTTMNGFLPELPTLIDDQWLASDSVGDVPLVTISQSAAETIQKVVWKGEDLSTRHTDEWSLAAMPNVKQLDGIIRQTSRADVRGRSVLPLLRNNKKAVTHELKWLPFPASAASLEGYPFYHTYRLLEDPNLIIVYGYIQSIFRSDAVLRWQTQRPLIQFSLMPDYPEGDNVEAGAYVAVKIDESLSFDGRRGGEKIVLLTSVQLDITTGIKVCEGHIVLERDPTPNIQRNRWSLTLDVVDNTLGNADELVVEMTPETRDLILTTGPLWTAPSETSQTAAVARFLDEWGREVAQPIPLRFNGLSSVVAGESVASFDDDLTNKTDIAYVVLEDKDTQTLNAIPNGDAVTAISAYFDNTYRFED